MFIEIVFDKISQVTSTAVIRRSLLGTIHPKISIFAIILSRRSPFQPMKRVFANILLAFILFSVSFSQDSKMDSLNAMTSLLTGNDLAKTYYKLSLELQEDFIDSALYFANQAELILMKNDPDNLLPHVYKNKGGILSGNECI